MAHWLVAFKNETCERLYRCSNCGTRYEDEYINSPKYLGICISCGEKITGSVIDYSDKYTKEKAEETRKKANECKEKSETANKIKEFIDRSRQRKPGTFERYMNDVLSYLGEKFPDLPVDKVMEAASYISTRANVMCTDLIGERDREWQRIMRKQSPKVKRSEVK